MEYDKDLRSIQEARDLIKNAKVAQKQLANWSQAEIDKLTKHICESCVRNAEPLAKLAQEETGFGKWEDKILKNLLDDLRSDGKSEDRRNYTGGQSRTLLRSSGSRGSGCRPDSIDKPYVNSNV